MSDMGFVPQTLIVNAGDKVVWKNTSEVTHNVVADPTKAFYRVDVKLPSGVRTFGSEYLQPGQSFIRVFEVPGVYHYVCTLHEGSGMKGIIVVKAPELLRASQ
jgi:plastocyanin